MPDYSGQPLHPRVHKVIQMEQAKAACPTFPTETTEKGPALLPLTLSAFLLLFFILAHINCTNGFHCDASTLAYNIL
jgi:hypothetical protein